MATSIPNSNPQFSWVLLCNFAGKSNAVDGQSIVHHQRSRQLLREADTIVDEENAQGGALRKYLAVSVVLLPVCTPEGGQSIVLRPVHSEEAMTANATICRRQFWSV